MIDEIVGNKLTKILKMHMHSCSVILVMQKIKMILVQINCDDSMLKLIIRRVIHVLDIFQQIIL